MGLSAGKRVHARHRADADCRADRGKASPGLRPGRFADGLILFASYLLVACAACAEPLRIATWHGDFSRKGPGLLLDELQQAPPDLTPVAAVAPDVLLLTDFDYDAGLVAADALRRRLAGLGLDFPHAFALRPNTGMATGLDIDGDGLRGGPRDAQGYGWFAGQGGMVLLSRHPLSLLADHSARLWKDVPDSAIAPDDPALAVQRLSSSAHWAVKVHAPGAEVLVLTLAATPPVFDGPEDRNGRRNRDEVLFWAHVLDGKVEHLPDTPVIVLGNLNLDPERGEGLREAAARLLGHSRLQDPLQGTATVSWDSTGPMRVSYVLPDRGLPVRDGGITAPSPDFGPHSLVWVELDPG